MSWVEIKTFDSSLDGRKSDFNQYQLPRSMNLYNVYKTKLAKEIRHQQSWTIFENTQNYFILDTPKYAEHLRKWDHWDQ